MSSPPFRFLDLPKEIRLMVYEHLPLLLKHHKVLLPFNSSADEPMCEITLIVRCLPMGILRTCRTIFKEANTIMQKRAWSWVMEADKPVRIIFQIPEGLAGSQRANQFALGANNGYDNDVVKETTMRVIGCMAGLCDVIRLRVENPADMLMETPEEQTPAELYTDPPAWNVIDAETLATIFTQHVPARIAKQFLLPLRYKLPNSGTFHILVRRPTSGPLSLQNARTRLITAREKELWCMVYEWGTGTLDVFTSEDLSNDDHDLLSTCTWLDERSSSTGWQVNLFLKAEEEKGWREWMEST